MLSLLKADFKIIFITVFLLGVVPVQGTAREPVLYKGIITAHKLNIRANPSRTAGVVAVAAKNDKVDVIEKKGGIGSWLKIVYKGKTGYVRNRPQYIRLTPVKKTAPPLKAKAVKEKRKAQTVEKKEIEQKIETQEKMVQTFSEKEVEIIEGLNEIDYALNKARIKVAALSQENEALEARISQLAIKRETLAKEIGLSRRYAAERLRALYKMNMIGRLDAAGLSGSVFDFFLQQDAMKRIISADFNVLEKQSGDLERFEVLESDLKNEMEAKTRLESELNDQIRINKKETLKRELILKEIRKKKKLSMAAVESLRTAARQLDIKMNSLPGDRPVNLDDDSFVLQKGRLILPVRGEIISTYGPANTGDYKSFTFQKGIDIKVERGEPVKSVFKGEVIFAEWLKGYGNLLIINHGDNYYTLYAHVEEMFKKQGEQVETGEVIATAGDTGSIKGMCLHFEVRHHGKPVNPMKWLRKGA